MKFVADRMLGRLARYLRILGYETDYLDLDDEQLIKRSRKSKAILLTRDGELAQKAGNYCRVILLRKHGVREQLKELRSRVRLRKKPRESFCPVCGGGLEPVPKKSIEKKVFSRVFKRQKRFWKCRNCGKIYWRGTHLRALRARLGD